MSARQIVTRRCTWMMGLDVTTRGARNEAEIDRIVDAVHATGDAWSTG